MKKDKLYIVNKWNMPAFMREQKNLFDDGGNTGGASLPTSGGGINWMQLGAAIGNTPMGSKDENSYWYTKRGGWDMLDPGYNAGRTKYGHLSTGVGDALGDAGVGVANAGAGMGNGYVMLAGAALKTVGNIINNGWGVAYNQQLIDSINRNKKSADLVQNYQRQRILMI